MYTDSHLLMSRGTSSPASILSFLPDTTKTTFLIDYLVELHRICRETGLNFDLLAAQSSEETGKWTSNAWKKGNPAGIGIVTGGISQNEPIFRNGFDAARIHAVHMWGYVNGDRLHPIILPYQHLDTRWDALQRSGMMGKVKQLRHLGSGFWADDPNYAANILEHAAFFNMIPEVVPMFFFQSIIPFANGNRPKTKIDLSGPLFITVHETGNPASGATARMHRDFTHGGGGGDEVSFHFVVDDHEAIQLLPLDEIGWHAGDGCDNVGSDTGCFRTVAIETCVNLGGNWNQTLRNLAELIAMISRADPRINWGNGSTRGKFNINQIAQHNQWSGKNCPQRIRESGAWNTLMTLVDEAWSASEPVPPAPTYHAVGRFPAWSNGDDVWIGKGRFRAFRRSIRIRIDTTPSHVASKSGRQAGPILKKRDKVQVNWIVQGDDRRWWYVTDKGYRIPVNNCVERFNPSYSW